MNNISHEIRTPLNGIVGFSELILQPGLTDEEKEMFHTHIRSSSTRLTNTISNYMDISLISSGNLEVNRKPFDLHKELDQLFEQFDPQCAEKSTMLRMTIPKEAPGITFYSDYELLRKALSHLLDNAIKFTAGGEISFGYTIKPGLLEFFVTDTGSGISKDSQKRVFENFAQEEVSLTRGHEGTGLGLAITQGIVRLLGGEIRVESEKGKGSTFIFHVPCEQIGDKTAKTDTKKTKISVLNRPVVLIAEDDPSNRFYLEKFFQPGSVLIYSASNGKEAVDQCLEHPEISLVLMDLKMPVMDGFEATRAIRVFRKDLPIIAITAFAMSSDKAKAMDAGCDDYLSKPISRELLLRRLKEYGVVAG
jgi:CheY-like chemotaxis protein/anti-sigma regulatory factor (Ser/Thr protein kinase)